MRTWCRNILKQVVNSRLPKNALVKQYQSLFKMENVELAFTKDAYHAIAKKALERKTGARGLRSIMENLLLDLMFDLSTIKNLAQVVINEKVVNGEAEPILVYEKEEEKNAG